MNINLISEEKKREREERMRKREENRGDGFPDTSFDENSETVIKEETDANDSPMDTSEAGEVTKSDETPKEEIKEEDEIKEEKPDTSELDASSQPNKVNYLCFYSLMEAKIDG